MLRTLHVRNLAVVEEASVELGPGFATLTGETGAGKSLVVDSLSLLGGARASTDAIRTGATELRVTGVFELAGARLERCRELLGAAGLSCEDGVLVVRREVARAGPNRVFLDDQPVTLRLLADIAPLLLRIHGQRDELGLLHPEQQLAWVDREGGAEAMDLLERVGAAWDRHRQLSERLERVIGEDRARAQRIDLLRFQRAEIDDAELVSGEEVELRRERDRLRHAEEIAEAAAAALTLLADDDEASAAVLLARGAGAIERLVPFEPEAESWLREADELRIRAEELASSVRASLGEVEADPRRLEQAEDRLALLERLLRKYGASSTEVLELRQRIAAELDELDADDERRDELRAEVTAALAEYREAALDLSRRRRAWADSLCARVERELRDLALGRARFAVRIEPRPHAGGELVRDGIDEVTFELAPNPGEELRPLARIASGGELARVFLALQVAVCADPVAGADAETLVFDEVDVGLGGAEAAVIGRKLRQLGGSRQVLAVTHLPQVACLGDRHYRVKKTTSGERTQVDVAELVAEDRVREIARMLAAERVTDSSLQHARALLDEAAAATRSTSGKRSRHA
ncbi:MAG TPA: DNA repair protein RecN [Thermoanaerobaculia bacterium]|nr:DNA repair protein RecN [Thermoanaerobaculia bacterium]